MILIMQLISLYDSYSLVLFPVVVTCMALKSEHCSGLVRDSQFNSSSAQSSTSYKIFEYVNFLLNLDPNFLSSYFKFPAERDINPLDIVSRDRVVEGVWAVLGHLKRLEMGAVGIRDPELHRAGQEQKHSCEFSDLKHRFQRRLLHADAEVVSWNHDYSSVAESRLKAASSHFRYVLKNKIYLDRWNLRAPQTTGVDAEPAFTNG